MKGGIIHIADILELETCDICSNHISYESFKKYYVFNNKHYIDYEWIQKQIDYINNLSDRAKHILRAYTIYGDKFINNYLRNTLTSNEINILVHSMIQNRENVFLYQQQDILGPSPNDSNYITAIIQYISVFIGELTEIINNSPPLTRQIAVFRGIKNNQYFNTVSSTPIIVNNEFISTSIYLPSATTDSFINGSCCLFEMTLNPGLPCIFTAHISRRRGEFEIILAPRIAHKVLYRGEKFLLNETEHYETTDVFINPSKYNINKIMTTVTESI